MASRVLVKGMLLSLSGPSQADSGVRVPTRLVPPAASRRLAALHNAQSSLSAGAVAVFAATRVIALVTVAWLAQHRLFRSAGIQLWSFLARGYDGGWYERLAAHGYPLGSAARAQPALFHFFPGYPAAIAAIAWIPGVGIPRAGVVVTTIAGLVAAAGIARLGVRLTGDKRIGLLMVALWAVAPGALVLSMTYTEALFCALAVWALVALLDRRWITAGVLAMLAGTVHDNGVALVAAVAVAALIEVIQAIRTKQPLTAWLRPVAAVVMAPLGLIGFWAFGVIEQGPSGGWIEDQKTTGTSIDWGVSLVRVVKGTFVSNSSALTLAIVLAILAAVALAAWSFTERIPVYLHAYTLVIVLLTVLSNVSFLGSKPRLMLPAVLLALPLARTLAPVASKVLVPMFAVLAAASAWFTVYAAVFKVAP
jgi:hypothetical protein